MEKYVFVAIDIQNDFASRGGKNYTYKPSIRFLRRTLFPYLQKHRIKISEIVSDYRKPRQGNRKDCSRPGEWGYESLIPDDLRKSLWIKCMNSPVWVRKNIGIPDKKPGWPSPDSESFNKWLIKNLGKPGEGTPILIGLTIDCCVLSTLQELSWRGYKVLVLREAVDHATGKIKDRDKILESPIPNWGKVINWSLLKKHLDRNP